MKKLYLATLIVMAVALMALPSTAQANLLTNPGFEDGSTGAFYAGVSIPGWTYIGVNGEVQTTYKHSGDQAVKMWGASDTGAYQDFAVNGSASYDISGYANPVESIASKAGILEIEWYQGVSPLTSEEIGRVDSSDTVGTWKLLSKTVTAHASADTGRIYFHVDGSGDGAVAWDDMNAVPEPTSLLLLGSGLVGLLGISRKKK